MSSLSELIRLKELFGVGNGDSGHDLNPREFVQALEVAQVDAASTTTTTTPTPTTTTTLTAAPENHQLKQLFRRIDANSDDSVDWNEYTNYLLLEEQGAHNLEVEKARCLITPQNFVEPRQNSGHHHREIIHTIIKLDKKQAYLTASGDGELKLWELKNLAFRRTIDHQQRVTCICFMPRPAKLVVGSVDRTLTFYEMTSFHPVGRLVNLQNVPQSLHTFDESLAFGRSSTSNKDVLLWGDDGGQLHGVRIHPFRTFHVSNFQINVSTEAIRNAHREADRKATMWRPKQLHTADGETVGPSSSSSTSSSSSSSVLLHTVVLGHGVDHLCSVLLHSDWITKVQYVPALSVVVTSSLDGTLKCFDLTRRMVVKTCVAPCHKSIHTFIYCPGITTKFIASSSRLSREIYLWNPHSASLHTSLSGHTAPIQCLCWDETSQHLISLDQGKERIG